MHGEVVQQLNGLFCPLQCAARSKLDFLLPCVVEKFRCIRFPPPLCGRKVQMLRVAIYHLLVYDWNQSEPSNAFIIPFWQRNTLILIKCLKLS
jgi:hypothetical protein